LRRLVGNQAAVLVEPSAAPVALLSIPARPMRASPVLTYIGRSRSYDVDKGLQDLLDLSKEWHLDPQRRRTTIRIRIVGLSQEEKEEIKRVASHLELDESLLDLETSLPPSAVPDVLAHADILCAPFPNDLRFKGASPLKLAEYAAAGKVILATRSYPVLNVLPENSFFSYEPGDVASMIECLEQILSDPTECLRRGSRAREYAREHTWQSRTERILRVVGEASR